MTASVMIVEDEMLVAADMEATIEELGHRCVGIATDTMAAVRLAEKQPDIALVDLNLSDGQTGAQIGEALAKRGIAVVFVTANPRIIADGVPGALGVLSKPCDESCIESVISYAYARRRGIVVDPPLSFAAFN